MNERTKALAGILFDQRKIVAIPGLPDGGSYRSTLLALTQNPNPDYEAMAENGMIDKESFQRAVMAISNLEGIGFAIDKKGFDRLVIAHKDEITEWYMDTYRKCLESAGGDKVHKPFYPNFPNDYIDHSDINKIIVQLAHYWFGYRPDEKNEKEGIKSLEKHPVKVLKTIQESEVEEAAEDVFKNLLSTKMNLPPHEAKCVLLPYISNVDDWTNKATVVGNRNTLCFLYALAMQSGKNTDQMPQLVTNDVLRIAKALGYMKSEDISSKGGLLIALEKTLYTDLFPIVPLKRSQYRALIKHLAKEDKGINAKRLALEDDFARDKEGWKIFLKHAHIKDPKNGYDGEKYMPLQMAAENLYHNNITTYYSRVEKAFKEGNLQKVLQIYQERPGEFIKNINRLLTTQIGADNESKVADFLQNFLETCDKTFPKMRVEDLYSLDEYLRSRTRENRLAIHNIKGSLYLDDKEYTPLPKDFLSLMEKKIKNAISEQITEEGSLKSIYVDPKLKDMAAPGKDRQTTSSSLNAYTRGSKLDMEKNEDGTMKNARMFIWWTNREDGHRVDVDLSFNAYDKNKKLVTHLGFSNSDATKYNCHHSGDITDGGEYGGKGATEYLDIDTETLRKNGIRYLMPVVNSYSGGHFKDLNCQFGWMEREELDKTEQFDITAVKQKTEIGIDADYANMAIMDLEEGKIIWTESPNYNIQSGHSALSGAKDVEILLDKYGNGDRMNMYEMVEMAKEAKGWVEIDEPSEADIVFSVDIYKDAKEGQQNITAKEQDIWIKLFMTATIPDERVKNKESVKSEEKEEKPIEKKSLADFLLDEERKINTEPSKTVVRRNDDIDR